MHFRYSCDAKPQQHQQEEATVMSRATAFLLCLGFLWLSTHAHAAEATNDAEVQRLRGELQSRGVATVPDPPKELGVHTACTKHGRACPDTYVDFLKSQIPQTKAAPTRPPPTASKSEKPKPNPPKRTPPPPPRDARPPSHSMMPDEKHDVEVQLENMRRLRNVLRDRLAEQTSPEAVSRCNEVRWLHAGLNVALGIYDTVMRPYWSFVVHRLFPCAALTALLTWIFFGDCIPREHLRCLLSCEPTFFVNELRKNRRRSVSVAELVMERESFNMSGSSVDALAASLPSAPDLERETHRRNRWAVTRFALLEAHEEARATIVVAKLRLVLSAAVFAVLLWTLTALPLRVADVRGGEGIWQTLLAAAMPAWLSASVALYAGWSWIGGMIAYAGWETLGSVDALIRADSRAAMLHERILQRWNA